nr:uncharacterized protein LOC109183092 [Ipomoea batatas]
MLEQCRHATLLEMQPKIDMLTQQLNILMKNMSTSSQCPQGVSADTPQSVFAPCDIPPTRSSCHSVDTYPVTTIKSKKKCYLAQCGLDGKMFVVAQGTAYPTTAETTIVHNQPVLPSHVKVMVDEVVIGAEDCLLPVPVLQYTTLNDVVGTYTQWPIHLVLLDEANVKIRSPRQNKPIKDPSVDLSAAGTRRLGLIVGENVFMLLGKNCKRLVKTLTSFPGDKEYLDVDLDQAVFHHGNVNGVFVMLEDIKDLLIMNWLDVSIIQVFMM